MRWTHAWLLLLVASPLCFSTARAQSPVFTTGTAAELEQARSTGLTFLQSVVRQPQVEIRVTRVSVDQLSMAHVRVQQFFQGIPVFGGEAIAHLRPDGSLASITDSLVPAVKVVVTPTITADQAVARARAAIGSAAAAPPRPPTLWVLRREDADPLAYRLDFQLITTPKPGRPVAFVDAHTGAIVLLYDNVQTETPR